MSEPTKTLVQAMADGDDLSKLFSGGKSESVSEPSKPGAPQVLDATTGKPTDLEPTKIPDGTFTPEEAALLAPKPTGPEATPTKIEPPETIAGSPFVTAEAAVEAYKSGQREIQKLRDQIEKGTPDLIKAGVKEELEKLLREAPQPEPAESEEEKALKVDDPETYRVLQLEKRFALQDTKQQADIENLQKIIDEMKQVDKARGITSEFAKVSADKNIPQNLLMAYGSLPQYANTSADELVGIVIKDLEASGIKLGEKDPDPTPSPTPKPNEAGLRSPVTGGSAAVANDVIDAEAVGPIGSPGWKSLRKRMVDVAFARLQGGAQ